MKRTVAITGSHPRTKDLAPYTDPNIDIWVFNEVYGKGQIPRCDAVFQMHKPAIWMNPANRNDPHHYEWLKENTAVPVYMINQNPEIPACVRYPFEEICNALLSDFVRGGGDPIRYFTSSINYAQALAIYQGYERIELYGVEMETNTEYQYQRDGVYFWMGLALGRGIEVVICEESELFRSPLYGYEGDVELNPIAFTKRLEEIEPKQTQLQHNAEAARAAQDTALRKAKAEPDPEKRKDCIKEFFAAINKQAGAIIDYGALLGALEENRRYKTKAETMEGAAGAVLFSRQEFEQSAAKAQDVQKQHEALLAQSGAAAVREWNELQNMPANSSQKARNRQQSIYLAAHEKYMKTALQFGRFSGIVQENLRYMQVVDELVRMAGGEKSEEAMIQARQLEAVNA